MANAIAFLPWLSCPNRIEVGPIRLLPYVRGKLPGNLPTMTQADMDGVLRAYSRHPGTRLTPLKDATLLEVGDWHTGMDTSKEVVQRLFDARRDLAFSALGKRRLFRQHLEYTNSDAYELVVQPFMPGDTGKFAFSTRRRDGGTSHFWTADHFAFPRPPHVEPHGAVSVDEELLLALCNLPSEIAYLSDAIVEFNSANTDSMGVPEHVEIVMVKSAFERLLRIGQDAVTFQDALVACLHGVEEAPQREGPVATLWARKWNNARPLDAWARDFCLVRSTSAHGVERKKSAPVWSATHHLAFASILFPLVVKKTLADAGRLRLDEYDLERLKRLQWYLVNDPLQPVDQADEEATHPWAEVDTLAYVYARAPSFYSQVRVGDEGESGSQ